MDILYEKDPDMSFNHDLGTGSATEYSKSLVQFGTIITV